jgi:hypothetical protein
LSRTTLLKISLTLGCLVLVVLALGPIDLWASPSRGGGLVYRTYLPQVWSSSANAERWPWPWATATKTATPSATRTATAVPTATTAATVPPTATNTATATPPPTATKTATTAPTATWTATPGVVGAAYYFDATRGNDSGAGTLASPWKTIAKANSLPLRPGDQVLFKCGETWSITALVPTTSGAVGLPITYASYGSGAKPIINAASATTMRFYNLHDIVINGLASTSSTDHAIEIRDCHRIQALNLDLTNGASLNSLFHVSVVSGTCDDIYLYNCNIHDGAANGLTSTGLPGNYVTNLHVVQCIMHDNGTRISPRDHGFYPQYTQCLLEDCQMTDNYCDGAFIGNGSPKVVFNRCLFDGNGKSASSGAGIMVRNGTLMTLMNSIISNNYSVGIYGDVGTVSAQHIYNNTIINNRAAGINPLAGSDNWTIENNIIYNNPAIITTASHVPMRIADSTMGSHMVIDHNLVYFGGNNPASVGGTTKTFAQWQALTGAPDAHGISADPVFVTNYTDLHPQTTSPCKSAGATDTGVLTDYDQVPRDATADIGAYEIR